MSYDPYRNQYIPPQVPVVNGYCPPPPAFVPPPVAYCPPPPAVVVPPSGHFHTDGQYHYTPPVVYPTAPPPPHYHYDVHPHGHHHHHHHC